MPSPTLSTRPISDTLASVPKPLICSFRIAEISAARTSISYPSGGFQCETQSVQFCFHGSVELLGAGADNEAANEAVVDAGFGFHLRAERLADRLDDGVFLRI